jgi:hypothetical protein
MSADLRGLLQEADPIRHEAPLPRLRREQLRLKLLRRLAVDRPLKPTRARRPLMAAVGAVMVAAVAFGVAMWVQSRTPLIAAVRFEVRLAEDGPIPGLVVAQVPDSRRLIYLHPNVLVSNDDIAQTWVTEEAPDQFGVAVQLLPSGAERMRQATASHVGRPVAVLIDGKVVIAPVVRAPISDSAWISGNYTRADAERLADGMRFQ